MKLARATAGAIQSTLSATTWFITSCLVLLQTSLVQSQDLSGKQIFERMLRVYAEANTYQDQGSVQTDFYELGQKEPKITNTLNFTTAYNRQAARFRFQYEVQDSFEYKGKKIGRATPPEKMVIWSQGNNVQRWWTIDDSTSREASLGDALAVATGVSGTSSRKVPYLLMPKATDAGWGIDSLQNVKLLGTDVLDKASCYRLTGHLANDYWKNKEILLWVDQKTFLLRRVDEADSSISKPKQLVKKSLTYQPILNQPVSEEALTFEPPRPVGKSSIKSTVRDMLYPVISLVGVSCLIYLLSKRKKQRL
ncbi:hypothetical protein [Spirosoma foliorum]|uniref:Uncharacterized protein n=1 Tax=Spirosoma foliorum TaxID=2710596 RepID=A0A7G5H3P4_9BACT|nr:hypothetical protein [Spirosoma foliorum]QMW05736.1 hypothetical protein H3H32_13010 [Spirosoma foliorum]